MKTLTKEEILKEKFHHFRNDNEEEAIIEAMQEFSDQENARLITINKKQAEMNCYLKRQLKKRYPAFDALKLCKLESELQSLQSGEEQPQEELNSTSWRDFTMTDKIEPQEEHSVYTLNCDKCKCAYLSADSFPEDQLCNKCFAEKYLKHHIEQKQTAEELRELISNAFTENGSDANNGQMSVITEDNYSDLIDEIIEIFQSQEPKCEECPSKQFYEANTAKIMDEEEPKQTAEEYYKSEMWRFDFGKTHKDGFVCVRQKDLTRFAKEYAQNQQPETSVTDEEIMFYFSKYYVNSSDMKMNYQVFTRGLVITFGQWMRDNSLSRNRF